MKLFNKRFSKPTFIAIIIIAITAMASGATFLTTFTLITLSTLLGVFLNQGLHKNDLIYIIIAYLLMLGYLFPDFINLAS